LKRGGDGGVAALRSHFRREGGMMRRWGYGSEVKNRTLGNEGCGTRQRPPIRRLAFPGKTEQQSGPSSSAAADSLGMTAWGCESEVKNRALDSKGCGTRECKIQNKGCQTPDTSGQVPAGATKAATRAAGKNRHSARRYAAARFSPAGIFAEGFTDFGGWNPAGLPVRPRAFHRSRISQNGTLSLAPSRGDFAA